MALIRPFPALMPKPEQVQAVSAVPYDVVNTAEAAALAEGNPLSFLRVSRPEIELPEGTDCHDEAVYARAKANFERLKSAAPLETDSEPRLYLYALTMNGRTQCGIIGTFSADEYFSGVIKKHEKTRQDKEDDRARHVMTLRSQTGPVFLTFRPQTAIAGIIRAVRAETPYYDFTAADGVRHQVWKIDSTRTAELVEAFKHVPNLYIADGHHRAAAGTRAARECRAQNPDFTGNEAFNFFMAVAFPADELAILPYNRLVKDLNNLSPAAFMAALEKTFDVVPSADDTPKHPHSFQMYLEGKWYAVSPRFPTGHLPVTEQLDVSILQNYVLSPLLNIQDPRTDNRIEFVGGIRGTKALVDAVNSGAAAVAFSMYPTTVEELMRVSDADAMMPPKSTWFEPKLRDGLCCHNF